MSNKRTGLPAALKRLRSARCAEEIIALIKRTNDRLDAIRTEMDELKKSTRRELAGNAARFDSMGAQMQALSERLEEPKARLTKLSDPFAQKPDSIPAPDPPPASQAPDPETLLRSGYTYLTSGQHDQAIEAFQQYLDNYGTAGRALDAQFHIGEAYFAQGKYAQAIDAYHKCLQPYPAASKLPGVELDKGFTLTAVDQKARGAHSAPDSSGAEDDETLAREVTQSVK